jgi:cellulose biosynthesis protein BcsQ
MKIIVFAATKGGTGKTTSTYNAAIEAANMHQVLIADLDKG